MATVLVVDDERPMRQVLRRFLEAEGHEVREAPNGAEALAVLQKHQIQMVFTDMAMPVMGGFALLQRMHTRFPDVKVVAMSSAEEILDLPAREMKIVCTLAKPFSREEALEALSQALL